MFKASTILIFLFCNIIAFTATAETGYISDKVYVYLHTGPGVKFRIIGSVVAGSRIEIVEKSADGKYTKIVDDKNRTGWIQSEFSSNSLSLREQFSTLSKELESVTTQQQQTYASGTEYKKDIVQLKQTITALETELATAKAAEKTALDQLIGEDQDIKIKWLLNGGMLVIFSLLFGVFLTKILSKKKPSGNWA
ncbi:MAG: TIGR04211 family SH3 domain-containing protein [Psychrobium sp.]|nr:TIGR04211 family SH3 domain-containing protein [Psychrobium sp.]